MGCSLMALDDGLAVVVDVVDVFDVFVGVFVGVVVGAVVGVVAAAAAEDGESKVCSNGYRVEEMILQQLGWSPAVQTNEIWRLQGWLVD